MAFGMFAAQQSPIAIDFGTSSVKLLQLAPGERPSLVAAAQILLPEAIASNPAQRLSFLAGELPRVLREGRFKGRRAVCSVPCGQSLVQHLQIGAADGISREDLVKAQLQTQLGIAPHSVVVRSEEVTEVHREGQSRMETICFAISRDTVMNQVELLKKCRIDLVGVHTEALSILRAFEHLHQGADHGKIATLYIDLGYGGTKVAIGHGRKLVFGKCVQLGGRHLDQVIAEALRCDPAAAQKHRLAHGYGGRQVGATPSAPVEAVCAATRSTADEMPAMHRAAMATLERRGAAAHDGPPSAPAAKPHVGVDTGELLDAISDELSMCVRYYQSLFPGRSIDRVIFLGGEARQTNLCRHIARKLGLPAQLGDPLSRLSPPGSMPTPGLKLGEPQPGWAVVFGLCGAPTDL
jgi:type IV pilus assembly protein PilM